MNDSVAYNDFSMIADAPEPLRKPYDDPEGPWLAAIDGADSVEFIAWANALRAEEAPVGALEIAMVDSIVQAARRLRKATGFVEADGYRNPAVVRELTHCERAWSKALAEWRRHRTSRFAKQRAETKAKDDGMVEVEVDPGSNPVPTTQPEATRVAAPRTPATSTQSPADRPVAIDESGRSAFLEVAIAPEELSGGRNHSGRSLPRPDRVRSSLKWDRPGRLGKGRVAQAA